MLVAMIQHILIKLISFVRSTKNTNVESSMIGPFFFETANAQAATANGQRYGEMLNGYFIPAVDNMDLVNPFFKQDGATCHTTRENMSVLRSRFPGHVIS